MSLPETLLDASRLIATGQLSARELLDMALARLAQTEPHIHAFSLVMEEDARADAGLRDEEMARGQVRGPLHGIPVALKDLIDVEEHRTSASSRQRPDHVATADAALVTRLRAAGAVILGKLHTHEFAFGVTTPTTRNPWDTGHVPGGSSGGSGAAVAAGGVYLGVGTDTGGSIRVPAALNGVVGLKPTYGRVSRRGVLPLSWSHDHAGPLARTVTDTALTLQAMAGHDPADPASAPVPVPDYAAALTGDIAGLRVGVPTNHFFDRLDPEVAALVGKAIDTLEALGAQLVPVEVPLAGRCGPIEGAISLSEGARVHAKMLRETPALYSDEVRATLQLGSLIPADAYLKAQQAKRLVVARWREMFARIDVLAAPVAPTFAARVGQGSVDWPDGTSEALFHATIRLCVPASLVGLPAISVPCGCGSAGLPTGLQIVGRPFDEATVLRVAHAYEGAAGLDRVWPVVG